MIGGHVVNPREGHSRGWGPGGEGACNGGQDVGHRCGWGPWGQGQDRDGGGTEGWHVGPFERCGCGQDAWDSHVCPKGPRLHVAHVRRLWTQHPVSHGLGMDALRYARLHADSDFIDISDSVHNLCEPCLSGLLRPEAHLGVGLGERADEVSRGEHKHVSWWPCCTAMFCTHGQGDNTAQEGCRHT